MSVHVAITRRVRAGSEALFEARLQKFAHDSLMTAGSRGVQLLFPPEGSDGREYGILRSFATDAGRDAFYQSSLFTDWESDIESMVEGQAGHRDLHGLEAWFRQPDLPRPPRWKMAAATLLGVYPTSLVLGTFVAPLVHGLPGAVSTLIIGSCMVTCLTWIVMPAVAKLLHPWLQPHQ